MALPRLRSGLAMRPGRAAIYLETPAALPGLRSGLLTRGAESTRRGRENGTQDQLVSLQTSFLEIKTEPRRQSRALLGNLMCLKLDNIE